MNKQEISIAEKQAIKTHMKDYMSAGMPDSINTDIRWGIPGDSDACQTVLILDDQYVVTFKSKHGEWEPIVYIEVKRATVQNYICRG